MSDGGVIPEAARHRGSLARQLDDLLAVAVGLLVLDMGGRLPAVNVEQLAVVNDAGVTRLVLHSAHTTPAPRFEGDVLEHPLGRQNNGLMFYTEEDTECGGLSHNHLSLDRYNQDQVVTVGAEGSADAAFAHLTILTRPAEPVWPLAQRMSEIAGRRSRVHRWLGRVGFLLSSAPGFVKGDFGGMVATLGQRRRSVVVGLARGRVRVPLRVDVGDRWCGIRLRSGPFGRTRRWPGR